MVEILGYIQMRITRFITKKKAEHIVRLLI